MGWDATGDSWADRQSGQDHSLPGLLAGFDHGGPCTCAPRGSPAWTRAAARSALASSRYLPAV